ncbi:hypothetical protein ISCGN_020693 [Ixodes scapularis]
MTFKVGDYGWVWDGIQWTPWRSVNPDQRDAQRPLLGFTLFIWIKRVKLDEAELQRNIQVLGGRVARLLDDAVTFVVTDQDPTKPSSLGEPLALSRGQLILSRAQKSTEATEDCEFIDRVRQARIKLWSVSQFLRWVEVHLNIQPPSVSESPPTTTSSSRKRKASRLPRPLVKLEDVQQEYKPVYKVFKSDPAVYVNPLYPSSPFDDPAIQERFVQLKRSTRAASCDSEDSDDGSTGAVAKDAPPAAVAPTRTPAAPVNKHQYCECCNAYFYNLQQHIGPDGTHHREFALREDNYECVKELIDCFPSLDDFVANGAAEHAVDRALLNDMHPSAYHLAMLNASAAATYRAAPPFPPRPPFDPGQVMVKQEPQDDPSPAVVHPGLLPVVGEQGGAAGPLDFSRTSQLSDICGQSFPREYVHHHVPPPALPHPPFLPEKAEEPPQQQQHPCWIGASKMDSSAMMPPHNHHHQHQPPVSASSHLPLENLSFLDQPHQDAMFTSELPQPDFSFGLQNLLHSICDEAEEDSQRRSGGSRSIDSNKENVERAACGSAEAASAALSQQQQFQSWPYSDTTSAATETAASSRCQPSVENSSSSPLELTAHNNPSEPPSASTKQTVAANRRRHSRDDEDATSNGTSENNPNRWTVERTRRGVGLKLKFTPARKQGSSLMSPPPPTPTRAPRGRAAAAAAAAAASAAASGGSSTFDVYDWNDEEDSECSDFVKMQWRVLHTEDTKVILCRTKQFALPRKQGKHVGGGKQLVY